GADSQLRVWVRWLDTLESRQLAGTEGAANGLFWSPDSRNIGFAIIGKLKKVDASGGPAQTVCDLTGTFRGGAWAPEGTIIFGVTGRPLLRVSEAGGVPAPLTALDSVRQEAFTGIRRSCRTGGISFMNALLRLPRTEASTLGLSMPNPNNKVHNGW